VVDTAADRQKGFDAGYAEGLAAGRAQAESIAAEMRALLDAMAGPFREHDAVLLRDLLVLTERVARAVIGRELDAGIDIEAVLRDALTALGSVTTPVELHLNPADAALCRGIGLLSDERLEITEDAAVQRGGLQLRAGNSFVDASVEARINAALSSLRAEAGLPEADAGLLDKVTDKLTFGE
jgi:flagellar assembly protein FliH